MSIPVALRSDYDAVRLRQLARWSKDAPQTRRLLALAVIYEGGSRTQAAEIGGVSLQTVRDWVLRFNARGPDGLLDGKAPGQPSILSDEQRSQLSEMIESGPIPVVHGVVRWRLADLMQWLWDDAASSSAVGSKSPWASAAILAVYAPDQSMAGRKLTS